jgi:lysophospholipase L1-like esterase
MSVTLGLTIYLTQQTPAKDPPFTKEIQGFKASDEKNPPKPGQILFIGSSTFTNWKNVNDYFPGKGILNRAFGGSTLLDLIRYEKELLTPYKPRQIVIYCGENDLAGNPKLGAWDLYERFQKFYGLLRNRLPSTQVLFVGIKPSWSRWHIRSKNLAFNNWIREFAVKEKNFVYVDMWKEMLDENGTPNQSIFIKDELHMNAEGYKLWAPILAPLLK